MMDNNQIRLSTLRQFYNAMYTGQGVPDVRHNPELAGIVAPVITANLVYLYEKGLINGEKNYVDNGQVIFTPISITAKGMDVVESILNRSLSEIDPQVSKEISKETATNKKLDKLYEACGKAEPVLEIVLKVAGFIFTSLH